MKGNINMDEFFELIKKDIFFKVDHYKSKDSFDNGDDCMSSKKFTDYKKAKEFYEDSLKKYKRGHMALIWMVNDGDNWMHIIEREDCLNMEKDKKKERYYVMYWNDREDYPVAVFEVLANSETEAEKIAYENGGDNYEDEWPLLTKTDEWMTEDHKKRYKNSVYTDYYDLTKKEGE